MSTFTVRTENPEAAQSYRLAVPAVTIWQGKAEDPGSWCCWVHILLVLIWVSAALHCAQRSFFCTSRSGIEGEWTHISFLWLHRDTLHKCTSTHTHVTHTQWQHKDLKIWRDHYWKHIFEVGPIYEAQHGMELTMQARLTWNLEIFLPLCPQHRA